MTNPIADRLRDLRGDYRLAVCLEAADELDRLRAALEPFAQNVNAVSLGEALGHITRNHLLAARDALKEKGDAGR